MTSSRPLDASRAPRSTRDRPAKAPLSLDAIVDAALAILKSEGLDALSMRRVAAALDTGAGSLYVYVSGREKLLEALFDRVIASVPLEAPNPKRWRAQLHSLLRRLRDELVLYPGISAAMMVDPPFTEATMDLLENLLGLLMASGVSAQDAAWGADILTAQVTFAAIEASLRKTDAPELAARVTANVAGLPPERFPLITANTAAIVSGDFDARFDFAVNVIVDGVLARAGRAT